MTTGMDKPLTGLCFHIRTFGCQMNENDSERLSGILCRLGGSPTADPEISDVLIINTCAVREKSVAKAASLLGRWKRIKTRRGALLGIAGCVAQLERDNLLRRHPYVDFVIGPDRYARLPEVIRQARREPCVETEWNRSWHEIDEIHRAQKITAFITIMEGCNNFCSYCVVPFTRGREKFRPVQLILQEAALLAEQGYSEIQLLGQNVNSYRDPETGANFASLLKRIDDIEGPSWIRFITSHPRDFTRELAETVAFSQRICHQIHLPIQAGSDQVLRRMNRGYTRAEYLERIDTLRELMPDVSLSADIIVGFPGETNTDFRTTLNVMRRVRYTNIFSFRYSPRPRTRALEMEDDVPKEEKRDRLIRVQRLQRRIQIESHRGMMGRTVDVLCLGKSRKDAGVFAGRNQAAQVVNFTSPVNVIGRIVKVKITGFGPYSLLGHVEKPF